MELFVNFLNKWGFRQKLHLFVIHVLNEIYSVMDVQSHLTNLFCILFQVFLFLRTSYQLPKRYWNVCFVYMLISITSILMMSSDLKKKHTWTLPSSILSFSSRNSASLIKRNWLRCKILLTPWMHGTDENCFPLCLEIYCLYFVNMKVIFKNSCYVLEKSQRVLSGFVVFRLLCRFMKQKFIWFSHILQLTKRRLTEML